MKEKSKKNRTKAKISEKTHLSTDRRWVGTRARSRARRPSCPRRAGGSTAHSSRDLRRRSVGILSPHRRPRRPSRRRRWAGNVAAATVADADVVVVVVVVLQGFRRRRRRLLASLADARVVAHLLMIATLFIERWAGWLAGRVAACQLCVPARRRSRRLRSRSPRRRRARPP